MKKAKIFQNGQSQAVRLPKEFRFDSQEVGINKLGNMTMLIPLDNPWAGFISSFDSFSKDVFRNGRQEPSQQEREDL